MNSDDFEKRVQRVPLRQLPPEWRREILQNTNAINHPQSKTPKHSLLSTLNSQLSQLLWPHPRAWAALAATWVVILSFHLVTRETAPRTMAKAPATRQVIMAIREQKWLMTQLNGVGEVREAVPSRSVPRPRSERQSVASTV